MRGRVSLLVCCVAMSGVNALPAEAEEPDAAPQIAVYRWANGTANVDVFAAWLGRDVVDLCTAKIHLADHWRLGPVVAPFARTGPGLQRGGIHLGSDRFWTTNKITDRLL